jgi:hypothetical protein
MARRRGVGPDVRQVVVAYQRTIQVFTDAGELASAAAGALRAAGRSLLNYDLTQLLAFRDEMSAFAVARIRATVALQGPAHRMILCAAVSCRRTPDLPAAVIVVSAGLVHESYVMEDDPNDDTLFNGRR